MPGPSQLSALLQMSMLQNVQQAAMQQLPGFQGYPGFMVPYLSTHLLTHHTITIHLLLLRCCSCITKYIHSSWTKLGCCLASRTSDGSNGGRETMRVLFLMTDTLLCHNPAILLVNGVWPDRRRSCSTS